MKFAFFIFMISACTANRNDVVRILKQDGCTDVVLKGHAWFVCSKDDTFANDFECLKNGKIVYGAVCSGFLKGYTIRYE